MGLPPLLHVEGLTVGYNRGCWNEKSVLRNLDLVLGEGECLVLTGANGSGKSTLVRALTGEIDQGSISGEIRLKGDDLQALDPQRRAREIVVIDQDPAQGTCAHLTVREQVSLCGGNVAGDVLGWLAEMDSDIGENQLIRELSGGQRQLLTVLMAVARRPTLLLADEPTASLDRKYSRLVMSILGRRAGQSGKATLLITHQDEVGRRLATRHVELRDGRISPV